MCDSPGDHSSLDSVQGDGIDYMVGTMCDLVSTGVSMKQVLGLSDLVE